METVTKREFYAALALVHLWLVLLLLLVASLGNPEWLRLTILVALVASAFVYYIKAGLPRRAS